MDTTETTKQNRFKYALHVFKPSWYKQQFIGWNKPSYILLAVGLLFLAFTGFHNGFNTLAVTSTVAGMIGFGCTLAITNQKTINGFLGFVSALLLIYVAMYTKNFSDVIMQSAYVILLDLPIMFGFSWNKNKFKPKKLNIKTGTLSFALFLLFFAFTFVLDYVLQSPQLWFDAFAGAVGLTGAVLTLLQFRASYYLWTLQGVASVTLWLVTVMNGHTATMVLMFTYILYLLNDVIAFVFSNWFKKTEK